MKITYTHAPGAQVYGVKVGETFVAGTTTEQAAKDIVTELKELQTTAALFISRTVSVDASRLRQLYHSEYVSTFLSYGEQQRLGELLSNVGILRGYLGLSERSSIFHQ